MGVVRVLVVDQAGTKLTKHFTYREGSRQLICIPGQDRASVGGTQHLKLNFWRESVMSRTTVICTSQQAIFICTCLLGKKPISP